MNAHCSRRRDAGSTRSGFRPPLLALVILLSMTFIATTTNAQTTDDMRVTNHLFAERVIETRDGGYIAQDVIVGFERGTHTFETLTQIVLSEGDHTIEMAIVDGKGAELERLKFGTLRASRDGWTQSLRGTWRNVRFAIGGVHELLVYRNKQAVTKFFLTVE